MPIIDLQTASLSDVVRTVLQISRDVPDRSFLWFRGHASSEYRLQPSIMRDGKSAEEIFDREKRLITRFRQRSLPFWPSGYPQNDWEHLFAMQHFGIPTRLLDWSENLFVALHFAAKSSAAERRPSVIWCLNPVSWNQNNPSLSQYGDQIQVLTTSDDEIEPYRPDTKRRRNRFPVAIFGTHNTTRIVAQRGTFMIWGSDSSNLETFALESSDNIWRISVEAPPEEIQRDLNMLGFGETMIFPELNSLGTELARVEGWR